LRAAFTDLEVASYQLNGFVAIPHFLDEDELRHWREVTDRVDRNAAPGNNVRGENISDACPDVAALWRDGRIGRLVGQLGGFDGVRHLRDHISYVAPGHEATPWHCNMHESWPVDTGDAIVVYVALDDYRWNNKSLVFIPGSHKIMPLGVRTVRPSQRSGKFADLLNEYPALRGIEPVLVEGAAGLAVFYNALSVHGSAPNMTTRVRRMASASFVPDGAVSNGLPWHKEVDRRAENKPLRRAGDPLTDEDAPLVWKRTDCPA
jgi:ectoine hydroxylase-related dioxygenase (phytanoyl-CoA dioxygenase family)